MTSGTCGLKDAEAMAMELGPEEARPRALAIRS